MKLPFQHFVIVVPFQVCMLSAEEKLKFMYKDGKDDVLVWR